MDENKTISNILEVKNITKIYEGGIIANHNINFSVREGEIHALVGENGAGKSTLMKILFGIESVTSGDIYFKGEKVHFTSSKDAIEKGLGMVHQHFMLIPSFTVAENLMLGVEKTKMGVFTDAASCINEASNIAKKYNFQIEPKKLVRDISVGMKQKLEILKALYRGAKVLILDEPTAVLTPQETDQLFEQLINLKKQGFTIIFISHKLNEVKRISDRLTILKSGMSMGTYNVNEITENEISKLMVGHQVILKYNKKEIKFGNKLLKVSDLVYTDKFGVCKLQGISLSVKSGEILGIAGVEGNGQSEFASIISGLLKPDAGNIYMNGKNITGSSPGDLRNFGLAHVPEDRMDNGCILDLPLDDNMVANKFRDFTNMGMMDFNKIDDFVKKLVIEFNIKTKDVKTKLKGLSGGNMQKAVVAREFTSGAKILLINHPTRGIDVGAEELIHNKMLNMREEGCAILLISADLTELLALSDRIVVFNKGKIVGHLTNIKNTTEEELGLYMLGLKEDKEFKLQEV